MGALQFRIISERLFACLTSPLMWGKARVEFITTNGQNISGEAVPMMILVMDGVGEGNLGMVTTFCHHNQAKVEASKALSALHQHDSPEPSVVVRRYTNSPYIPWGSFSFLYLEMSTLSWGHFICPIPTGPAMPMQATPLLQHWGGPAMGGGRGWVEGIPLLLGGFVAQLRGGALPLQPNTTVSLIITPIHIKKRAPRWKKDWAFSQPSNAVARYQLGQSSAGMQVSPGRTGVG